ncbi:MAG: thiamine diphosphokinase [Chloroflexi bacterium]|nr:thiamine diphosphokinase [Chloroflexota bacterium]
MAGLVVVALGGPTPDTPLLRARIADAALFIAADSGARRLAALGLRPDLLTGDFDSLTAAQREAAERAGAEVVPHPEPQQTTDGAVALRLAVERGARSIVVLGAHGGERMDHSLGNLLAFFDPALGSLPVTAVDGHSEATALRAGGRASVTFEGRAGDYVSLLPVSAAVRVSTQGLRWPLADASLSRGMSRALSNELLGTSGGYALSEGAALAVHVARGPGAA